MTTRKYMKQDWYCEVCNSYVKRPHQKRHRSSAKHLALVGRWTPPVPGPDDATADRWIIQVLALVSPDVILERMRAS